MSRDMYSGPAPVALAAYVEVIRAQSVMDVNVHRPELHKAFENLVVSDTCWINWARRWCPGNRSSYMVPRERERP